MKTLLVLSFALHYSDWAFWDISNDYSNPTNVNSFVENSKIWITDLEGNLLGGNTNE